MPATLIENNDNGRIAYDSLILSDPRSLSVLNSRISMKIVKLLAESPCCAIDVARKLKIHEQKIYYHLRNLEKAGIVYIVSQERRHGMIARNYSVVSPVVAAKLFDRGVEIKEGGEIGLPPEAVKFFHPFIENGIFNSKIIVGNPYPHGKYDTGGLDACYGIDLALFIGGLCKHNGFPVLKLDTLIKENELKENLIIVGGPMTNSITLKLNPYIPFFFDEKENLSITSKFSKVSYKDDSVGIIIKMPNPFNGKKSILLLAGRRTRGTQAAVLAITKCFSNVFTNTKDGIEIAKIVRGIDEDSDDYTDNVKVLE